MSKKPIPIELNMVLAILYIIFIILYPLHTITFIHSLILTSTNKVYGCGNNQFYQLGLDNIINNYYEFTLIDKLKYDNVSKINACINVSLFLINNGNIYTCGDNKYGLNGINIKMPVNTNIKYVFMSDSIKDTKFIDVNVGFGFIICLSDNGRVYGWGNNNYGQIRYGLNKIIYKPTRIYIKNNDFCDLNIIKVVCGNYHSILMDSNYNVWVCGKYIEWMLTKKN